LYWYGLWQLPAVHVLAYAARFDARHPRDLADTDEIEGNATERPILGARG